MFKISEFNILNTAPRRIEVIDYGVQMIGAPLEWKETMGEGIRVGVIDTGVDVNHEDLKDRVAEYMDFTDDNSLEDFNGHGTHVCGIIGASLNGVGVVGVAPKCSLYVAKAFNEDGTAKDGAIVRAMRWLISKNVQIINMSFASEQPVSELYEAVKEAYRKDIVLIGAAGNSGSDKENTIGYPAKWKEVVAVTAVDIDKNYAEFSSAGKEARLAAAGIAIYSTFPHNTYRALSGTSMASPLIAGASAILQSKARMRFKRFLTPHEIGTVMGIYADDLGNKGRDERYGYGVFSFGRIN